MQNGLVVLAHFLAINVHATTGNSVAILSRQSQELNEAWEAKLPLPHYRPGWRHIGRSQKPSLLLPEQGCATVEHKDIGIMDRQTSIFFRN